MMTTEPSNVLFATPAEIDTVTDEVDKNIFKQVVAKKRKTAERPTAEPLPISTAYRNNRGRFFVTGTDNFFGPVRVKFVMIDSGCNSLLLPLAVETQILAQGETAQTSLSRLVVECGETFSWDISYSIGVASKTPVLILTPLNNNKIPVRLSGSSMAINIDFLRFHLCYEDASRLHTELRDFLTLQGKAEIDRYFAVPRVPTDAEAKRRDHAILGQSLLMSRSPPVVTILYEECIFLVQLDAFDLNWDRLAQLHSEAKESMEKSHFVQQTFDL